LTGDRLRVRRGGSRVVVAVDDDMLEGLRSGVFGGGTVVVDP